MSNSAQVQLSGQVLWDDGTSFDGYLVFSVVVPVSAQDTGVTGTIISTPPTLSKSYPAIKCGLWMVIPVRDGYIATASKIWKSTAYNPKGCVYKLYIFDNSWQQLNGITGIPAGTFSVTGDTYSLTIGPVVNSNSTGSTTTPQVLDVPWAIGGGASISPVAIYVAPYILTAPTTNISYPVAASGALLIVDVTQDGTGNREVTFGAEFVDYITNIRMGAGERTSQMFRSDGTNWLRITWMA